MLADRLHITRGEATRRIADARDLGTRQTLTGEPLAPRYAAAAGAQRAGHIGASHIAVIHRFFDELPCGSMPTPVKPPRTTWPAGPANNARRSAKTADRLTAA